MGYRDMGFNRRASMTDPRFSLGTAVLVPWRSTFRPAVVVADLGFPIEKLKERIARVSFSDSDRRIPSVTGQHADDDFCDLPEQMLVAAAN